MTGYIYNNKPTVTDPENFLSHHLLLGLVPLLSPLRCTKLSPPLSPFFNILSGTILWMSDSRSTPTTSPITSTSKIPPSLDISSSPSRTQIYETKDSQGSSTTPRTRTLSLKHNIHSPNNHRRPAEGNSPDHRPTKKMRRHHSEERSEGHSSPSNSSHSGIGDHEERSQLSEASSAPTTFEFAPAKKKRTRTLTTPHQAAILHSLLAQVCG